MDCRSREDYVYCYIPGTSYVRLPTWGVQEGYCMSQAVEERCALHFSRAILLVVIGCNAIKFGCLLWTLLRCRDPTLVTLGDAIASFLETPDKIT